MTIKPRNILCMIGSANQTSQLHQIASHLSPMHTVKYTQVFGSEWYYKFFAESGMFDFTVIGVNSRFIERSRAYMDQYGLEYDYRGETLGLEYDLIILSTDLIVPNSFKTKKSVWIQEGMIDPLTPSAQLIKKLGLPTVLAGNTSLNGTANFADIYFSASLGYKEYFCALGTEADKILATGVPNFDNIQNISGAEFEHQGYVLVATSDIRELGGNENRIDFIKKCVDLADGKQLIFKLHPNEDMERSKHEIINNTPQGTLIYDSGPIDPMVKNCDILITQFSSTVYLGLELGKKIYSYFDIDDLIRKRPIQNQGKSAEIIAQIIEDFLAFEGDKKDFVKQSSRAQQYL